MVTCMLRLPHQRNRQSAKRTRGSPRRAGRSLALDFRAPLTTRQWKWLQDTKLRFCRVRFHPEDTESSQLLLDETMLVSTVWL